ncbi:hypothetical protein Angca_006960, partial [Angiostrongylus cantonensis]
RYSDLHFLKPEVAKNVLSSSRCPISKLRRIQKCMIPLVLNEVSFLAIGPSGCGKTCGYLLPLINKLVELKEMELRKGHGPIALVVAASTSPIVHLKVLWRQYGKGIRIVWWFARKEKPSQQQFLKSYRNVDVFCACSKVMVNVISEFQVSLKFVRFLVIEQFERSVENYYKEDLTALKEQLSVSEAIPVCIFLSNPVHEKGIFDINFMKELARTKLAKLMVSSLSGSEWISVLPCQSVMHRFHWITRLIVGEGVAPTRTVVFANAPERVQYLVFLLAFYGMDSKRITRDDNLLAIETAIRLRRTEDCCIIVADYDSMEDIDYEYVETCILFELPVGSSSNLERRLLDLSIKLKYCRRIHIMVNVDLDHEQAETIL